MRTTQQATADANERYLATGLRGIMQPESGEALPLPEAQADPVMAALGFLAALYHLPLDPASVFTTADTASASPAQRAQRIMEANHWRVRSVHLLPDMHTRHTEQVLGFRKADGHPLIVCPCGAESHVIDPVSLQRWPLVGGSARGEGGAIGIDDIESDALRVYELLPQRPLTWRDVATFALRNSRALWQHMLFMSGLCGLLGLLQPLATEYVTGTLIPTANNAGLWQLMVLLVALTCSEALLGVAPNLRFIAFSAQRSERFEAAVFDRLFRLPLRFFRRFDSGDLGIRVMAISGLHTSLVSLITEQLMSLTFTFFSFCMLLYYSWKLSLVGLALTLVYGVLMLLLLRQTLPHMTELAAERGRMASFLKQVFDGMGIIKVCGAEQRVLRRFFTSFLTVNRADYAIQLHYGRLEIFGVVFGAAVTLFFFWLVGDVWRSSLDMPQYLAFMAAFAGFQRGILGLCEGIWSLWQLEPERQRLAPILEEATEQPAGLADPGVLDGSVAISRVTFRYEPHLPPALIDVSITANPGEFIGIVGPSGAGKSSLLRLLVGFEQPESGGIFYSGKNLAGLRLHAVRKQLGCILQGSRLMPGTILNSIIAGTNHTLEDAMEAARLAGLDADIEAMPMGMHTLVGEGLLSGGQAQRLLLARALVGNPPILLLDEATSALDNVTQHRVWTHLESLRATRLVIAHRLSTIVGADRLFVIDQGRVVETGSFDELVAQNGLFSKLARRQLL